VEIRFPAWSAPTPKISWAKPSVKALGILAICQKRVKASYSRCRRTAKSGKTAEDAKSENSDFRRFLLFFLGDLGALGGSKIDFAILLTQGAKFG